MLENRTVLLKADQIESAVQMRSQRKATIITVFAVLIILEGPLLLYFGEIIGIFIFFLGITILILSSKKKYYRTIYRQYYASIPNDAVLISHTVFSEDQVVIHDIFENEEISSCFSANRYVSFMESKDFLILKDKMNLRRIIRKDSFVNGNTDTFKEYLRNHGIRQTK